MPGRYFDGANATTGLNLLTGVGALYCALHQRLGLSLLLLFVAVLLDQLDGYLARRFYAGHVLRRAFGKQFDTLADLLNFNLLPAVQLLMLIPRQATLGVAAALVLFGAVRLAHFTLESAVTPQPPLGLPTTYAGFLLLNLMMLQRANHLEAGLLLLLAAGIALLQVVCVPVRLPAGVLGPLGLGLLFLLNFAFCGFPV
jgi:CDP-diacylglycerol--serine O-phosphatidyltransferase